MANDEWRTPEWVWKPYAPFDLDAAATEDNALAPKFITKEMDARKYNWRRLVGPYSRVWCNPPYSQEAGPLLGWVRTFFYNLERNDFSIITLLPADTSTQWFHLLWEAHSRGEDVTITFLKRRVRHIDPETGKPGGSPKFGSLIAEFIP